MRSQESQVRRFYDRNTAWMLRFGTGRGEAAIHRPVWAPRARTRAEAIHTVDLLTAAAVGLTGHGQSRGREAGQPLRGGPEHLLDLGCGVGGSAVWLAEHYAVRVTGVTLSPVQARAAGKLAARKGLSDRCRFLVADYTHLPEIEGIAAVYAVESFSHGADVQAFFREMARVLASGAKLILCDDFLTRGADISTQEAANWLSRFSCGWRLGTLQEAGQVMAIAADHGFESIETKNLSPFLRPAGPVAALFQQLAGTAFRRTSWGASLYGGRALEICLKNGWVEYLFLVLQKR